ncbi:MAG: hypothetical protein GY928_22210 [Colwellia sp.]|nr:hypothetical protein [Colwellia sp.]
MKYNGMELKPIEKVQAFEKPRDMLCWNYEMNGGIATYDNNVFSICAIVNDGENFRAITKGLGHYKFCAEIPKPKTRKMNSLEVMEYLHTFQNWLNGNKKELLQPLFGNRDLNYGIDFNNNLSDGNFDGGLVVKLNTMCESVGWQNYSLFSKIDSIKTTKFGILKNGKVTEFELPEIEVNDE